MAAILWTDVVGEAGELSTTPALAQTAILMLVNTTGVSTANFGGEDAIKTRMARIMLAAHMATMLRRRGVAGGISSQSEGGVSQSYYVGLANPRALDLTGYGQIFRLLCSGTPARAGALL